MLSKVLSDFLAVIEGDPSPKIQAAARDARMKLEHEAKTHEACKKCEKAGWITTLQKSVDGYQELVFNLGKCEGGVILQPNELSFGLQMPIAPFFCSSSKDDDHRGGRAGGAAAFASGGKTESQNDGWPRQRRG